MDNPNTLLAIRLETLLPKVMRALFNPDPEDPMTDLPMAQLRMVRLLTNRDYTVSELSEEFNLSMSACTQMVNRLETMGLVTRRGDEGDRRIRHVTLSEKGKRQMQDRHQRRVARAEKVLDSLPEGMSEQVVSALEALVAATSGRVSGADSVATTAELEQALPSTPPYSPTG